MKTPYAQWTIGHTFASVLITAFVLFFLWHVLVQWPKAKALLPGVKREFAALAIPPQATQRAYSPTTRPEWACVSAHYTTTMSKAAWRAFYIDEFMAHGWTFRGEQTVTDWGTDYGYRTLVFSKGRYTAGVDWVAGPGSFGYDYSVGVSVEPTIF